MAGEKREVNVSVCEKWGNYTAAHTWTWFAQQLSCYNLPKYLLRQSWRFPCSRLRRSRREWCRHVANHRGNLSIRASSTPTRHEIGSVGCGGETSFEWQLKGRGFSGRRAAGFVTHHTRLVIHYRRIGWRNPRDDNASCLLHMKPPIDLSCLPPRPLRNFRRIGLKLFSFLLCFNYNHRPLSGNSPGGSRKWHRGMRCRADVRAEGWLDSAMFLIGNERAMGLWSCRCHSKRNQQPKLLFCFAIGILWRCGSCSARRPKRVEWIDRRVSESRG